MKSLPSLLAFVLFAGSIATAQNYRLFPSNRILTYRHGNSLYTVKTDSIAVDGTDTLFFSQKAFQVWEEYCYDADVRWHPYFVREAANGDTWLYNLNHDSMLIKTRIPLNGMWTFFRLEENLIVKATCSYVFMREVFGSPDSIKQIVLQATDTLGNPVTGHYLNDKIMELSKNHGMTLKFAFRSFPYGDYPLELCGLSNPEAGLTANTGLFHRELEPGDLYHIQEYDDDIKISYTIKEVISKTVLTDTILYYNHYCRKIFYPDTLVSEFNQTDTVTAASSYLFLPKEYHEFDAPFYPSPSFPHFYTDNLTSERKSLVINQGKWTLCEYLPNPAHPNSWEPVTTLWQFYLFYYDGIPEQFYDYGSNAQTHKRLILYRIGSEVFTRPGYHNFPLDCGELLAVKEHPVRFSVSVSPNPSKAGFEIKISGAAGCTQIDVYRLDGTRVFHFDGSETDFSIHTTDPGKGIYIMNAKDASGIQLVGKIMRL